MGTSVEIDSNWTTRHAARFGIGYHAGALGIGRERPDLRLLDGTNRMRATFSVRVLVLAWLSLAAVIGCGDRSTPVWPVQGKVVYQDGSPLPGGTIEFESKDNSTLTAVGTIAADGTFQLEEGAATGSYRVAIHPVEPIDPDELDDKKPAPLLDAHYGDVYSSGLEQTIQPKENTLTITVEKP